MGDADVVASSARLITELFLAGSQQIRAAIEAGFLEHALETVALRPYFEDWSSDPQLKEAWERALDWGEAHPDFSWKMLQALAALERKEKE